MNRVVVEDLLRKYGGHLVYLATENLNAQKINHPLATIVCDLAGDRLLTDESSVDLSSDNATDNGTENVGK